MGALDGKVVVVTGAGRGLGRAFATGFANEGARVVLVGRRLGPAHDPETLAHTEELIRVSGGSAICCPGSVADIEAMQQMAYQAVNHFGGVDILVNNAGMYYTESFSDMTMDQWQETLDGFLTGAFVCSKVITPLLIQRGGGHIINLGSGASSSTDAGAFAYGVIRGGMVRMTIKMAADLRRHRIAVNSYAPGFTLSERVVQVVGENNPALARARQAEESVPHLVWIAQQAPEAFTGQVVSIDDWSKSWGPGTAQPVFAPAPGPSWTTQKA